MSRMAEARAVEFCTHEFYIKSCQRDDKWSLSISIYVMC